MNAHIWEIDHPYYMTVGNYFQAGCHTQFKSWAEFASGFGDSDMDYNWVIRWDWLEGDDWEAGEYNGDDNYRHARLLIQMVMQRKALLQSYEIEVCRADEPAIIEFLRRRWEYMKEMWAPFSDDNEEVAP